MNIGQLDKMMDATKALVCQNAAAIGLIARSSGVPFRKTLIDFLARSIHAAYVVAERGEGAEQFEDDLRKAIDSYNVGS